MDRELQLLLPLLDEKKEVVAQSGVRMVSGTMEGHDIVVLKSGIGKVNAAVGASALIDFALPGLIINTGVAGGAGATNVLDVVVGAETAYHDVWCGPGNAPGQVQGHPERYEGATALFDIRSLCADPNVKIGLIASGDKFVSTPGDLEAVLRVQPEAVAVDMESGAIAQVCHLRNVPFLAIRVVSDTPGVENHLQQYGDFWSLAPKSTFGVLRRLLSA